MSAHRDDWCCKYKRRPVEVIDDFVATMCSDCNDRDVERYRERQEWNYYHLCEDTLAQEPE